ncbi:hypothetical protein CDCA_CDCA07G2204 [Cyanidium caldarium]|uniref:Uncharacterized protein n=1 Tax=Cyanidium caldarium TaxID=2771 RepID=A0AAV9IVL3_CYACA|nr:hypothetical protein CDCA_CDCA07G2204 [Cyanidium caldarium]
MTKSVAAIGGASGSRHVLNFRSGHANRGSTMWTGAADEALMEDGEVGRSHGAGRLWRQLTRQMMLTVLLVVFAVGPIRAGRRWWALVTHVPASGALEPDALDTRWLSSVTADSARAHPEEDVSLGASSTTVQTESLQRCESVLAQLQFACRVVDSMAQLKNRPRHHSLETCHAEQDQVLQQCVRERRVPTRDTASLTAPALRTVPYFLAGSWQTTGNESGASSANSPPLTLATHWSTDKLEQFIRQARQWPGPISATVFVRDPLTEIPALLQALPPDVQHRTDVHLLLSGAYARAASHYPFNAARNLALDNVRTPFALMLDVDFLPSASVLREFTTLMEHSLLRDQMQQGRALLVVPAFEVLRAPDTPQAALPRDKRELTAAVASGTVAPFHVREYWSGHGPTDFKHWLELGTPANVDQITSVFYRVDYVDGFEPYLIAYTHGLPRYDDRFVGYGWNKQSFVKELSMAGYHFYVMPESFLLHINHPYTPQRNQQKHENLHSGDSSKWRSEERLRRLYGEPLWRR